MVSVGPSMAMGGITAFTRYPFGKRAFTMGLRSSTRRPNGEMMRSRSTRICSSDSNSLPSATSVPRRSINVWSRPLTMISVTASSSKYGCSGPRPTTSSKTSAMICSRSSIVTSRRSSALTTASSAGLNSRRPRSTSPAFTMRATSEKPTRSIIKRMMRTRSGRGDDARSDATTSLATTCTDTPGAVERSSPTASMRRNKLISHHSPSCPTEA